MYTIPLDWVRSASAWSWRSCPRSRSNVGGAGSPPRLDAARTNRRGVALAGLRHAPAAGGSGATSNDAKAISPLVSSSHRTAVAAAQHRSSETAWALASGSVKQGLRVLPMNTERPCFRNSPANTSSMKPLFCRGQSRFKQYICEEITSSAAATGQFGMYFL